MSSPPPPPDTKADANEATTESQLYLFDLKGSKKPEYWIFIKLIAPDSSKKKWKSSDCIGSYCTKCEKRLKYSPSNPASVPRHMKQRHEDELLEYENKKMKRSVSLELYTTIFVQLQQQRRLKWRAT